MMSAQMSLVCVDLRGGGTDVATYNSEFDYGAVRTLRVCVCSLVSL